MFNSYVMGSKDQERPGGLRPSKSRDAPASFDFQCANPIGPLGHDKKTQSFSQQKNGQVTTG